MGAARNRARREGRARSVVESPHWWAVLAVSLALMALVATLTSGTRGAPRAAVIAGPVTAHRPSGTPGTAKARHEPGGASPTTRPPSEPSVPKTGTVGFGPNVAGPTTSAVAAHRGQTATRSTEPPPLTGTSSGTQPVATPPATTTPTQATTATTATTVTAGPSSTTTSAPSTTNTRSEVGTLTSPTNLTARYTFAGTGSLEATAIWSGTPHLELSATCSGSTVTRTGTSGLSVTVPQVAPGGAGTCTVSIAETPGIAADVSYLLDIRVGNGSGS